MKNKILLAEGNIHDCQRIKEFLERKGYIIIISNDGEDAVNKAIFQEFDLILLSLRLPKKEGVHVLKEIRKRKGTPIIMMGSNSNEKVKDKCLAMKADDFIIKPCCDATLIKRVNDEINTKTSENKICYYKDIIIDFDKEIVTKGGENANITPKEMQILKVIINKKGNVVPREIIKEMVYGNLYDRDDTTISSHISGIRKKLYRDFIISTNGSGYKINF